MSTSLSSPYVPDARFPAIGHLLPGLLLSGAVAAAGMLLGRIAWLQDHGFSALTLAIVLGMVVGNTVYPRLAGTSSAGVDLAKQRLLRLGVVLYGLRLTLQDVGHVGLSGVAIDALVLCSTFLLAWWIGTRWLGLERRTAMLIGAGGSICGAAAVMATAPVVKARAEQVTVAVATVVVFGTLAIFLYPVLFQLSAWLARDDARNSAGPAASAGAPKGKLAVPWFAFGFIGVVLFNSLHWLPQPVVSAMTEFDTALLATAMAALGLTTQVGAIRKAGAKPLLLALILFSWLVVGGAMINRWVPALLA